MEEVMKAPVTETVEEVKAAAAEETEVKEEASAQAEETEVKEEAPAQAEETEVKEDALAEEAPAAEEPKAEEAPAAEEAPKAEEAPAESMADYEAEIDASLRRYERDEKVKCTVISVDVDKVMVELGSTTGIIRKQDVSDDPSYNLQENIKPGDEIEATVLRSDDGHGHVVLSMKAAATAKAWNRLTSLLESKDNVGVKITGITKAGVITMLEGVRGFIPASKLSLGYVAEDDLQNWIGKTIEARVITAEQEGRKLVLSAKEILREKEAQERKDAAAQIKVGLVTEGTVETIKDYGAFVSLGKGVTGLLHVSQISQKRIKTPAEVLEVGQKVKVKVTKVADGRISLSMKALEESASPEAAEEKEEFTFKLPKSENIGTGLGDLLKGLKLN